MECVCISVGGSILSREDGINVAYAMGLKEILKKYDKKKFILVVGGGYASRLYINSSRKIIKNNSVLDEIGIAITRINALILKDLISSLDVYPNVVSTLDELRAALNTNRIVVMGGLLPGISTDSVSIIACEISGSNVLINASKESYIYNKNPLEKEAKKFIKLSHDELIFIASQFDTREAGSNFIFDLTASKLAKRGSIELRFVNDKITELELAIEGKTFNGTTVR